MAGKSNIKGPLQSQEPNPRVMRYMVPVNPFKEEPGREVQHKGSLTEPRAKSKGDEIYGACQPIQGGA